MSKRPVWGGMTTYPAQSHNAINALPLPAQGWREHPGNTALRRIKQSAAVVAAAPADTCPASVAWAVEATWEAHP